MKITEEKVWAGTESSLNAALEANEAISKRMAAGQYAEAKTDEPSRLLDVQDGVATISIKGPLNNEEGFWNELFGMTGYPEIRSALLDAASDPAVSSILLDIDSGGGAVSGVADTANLIRMVNDNVKPVTTFTDGTMASAAYWLGSSAGNVLAGRTALVGSIGVISTHMERSAQLKADGIGVTVVRAGKYKALANSVEPLSAEGKAQIQQAVDASYTVFVEHVAEMRNTTYAVADQGMAQGQEFIGEAALKAGLVDSITTFDAVISDIKAKSIDASKKLMDNRGKLANPMRGSGGTNLSGDHTMKRALTEQDIAALAAGGTVLEASAEVVEQNIEAGAEGAAEVVAEAGAEGAAEVVAEVVADNGAIQILNNQLAAKDEALLQAGIKISNLEAKVAEVAVSYDAVLDIARKSVNNMQVALGGSALDLQGMTAASLVAEHMRLSEQFASKFKAGGIAAVSAEQSAKQEPQVSPRHRAMVNAVRHQK